MRNTFTNYPHLFAGLVLGLAMLVIGLIYNQNALIIWGSMFTFWTVIAAICEYIIHRPLSEEQKDFDLLDTFK